MLKECAEADFLALEGSGVSSRRAGQFVEMLRRVVGQRVMLEVSPDVLGGIQLRRVGRKELGMKMGVFGQARSHPARLVRSEAVPRRTMGPRRCLANSVRKSSTFPALMLASG